MNIMMLSHLFKTQKDIWDILQVLLIPTAIGFGSVWIQKSIAKESVAKDYVEIATTILERPKQEGDDALRKWATNLLVHHAPKGDEFNPKAQEQLESQGLGLAALSGGSFSDSWSSPDQTKKAMMRTKEFPPGGEHIVFVYDDSEKIISQFDAGFGIGVSLFAWSQDNSKLLVYWPQIGRVFAFNVAQNKPLGAHVVTLAGGGTIAIRDASFGEDGRSVIIKTADNNTEVWQLP